MTRTTLDLAHVHDALRAQDAEMDRNRESMQRLGDVTLSLPPDFFDAFEDATRTTIDDRPAHFAAGIRI